jgi:hypothetical protein
LSSCLKYDSLYKEAIGDPLLKRTRQELEVAMTNANLAREVVFELFQDLDRFNLGDYRKYDDEGQGMQRLVNFIGRSARLQGGEFVKKEQVRWRLAISQNKSVSFTTDRDLAIKEDNLDLVGLEHPVIRDLMRAYRSLDNTVRAVAGNIKGIASSGLVYIWLIQTQAKDAQLTKYIIPIAVTEDGGRAPWLEKLGEKLLSLHELPQNDVFKWKDLAVQNKQRISEILHRDLQYSGMIEENMSYSSKLLAVFGLQAW